jgi:undecaprenyl-diphosphatase
MDVLYWKAVAMGLLEGITEFLPVSSTGHLILLNEWIGFGDDAFSDMFEIVIQMGAILAVVVYFRRWLWPWRKNLPAESRRAIWSVWGKTLVGVLPALLVGFLSGDWLRSHMMGPGVVVAALGGGGIVLLLLEWRRQAPRVMELNDLSFRMALVIGLIQCLAMIPGTSRSAATIIGAMLLGCSRVVAAEYSFFLAIPTLGAASAYALLEAGFGFSSAQWLALAVGSGVAFVTALAVVAFLMRYLQTRNFIPFAVYRIILAAAVCWLLVLR